MFPSRPAHYAITLVAVLATGLVYGSGLSSFATGCVGVAVLVVGILVDALVREFLAVSPSTRACAGCGCSVVVDPVDRWRPVRCQACRVTAGIR